MKDKMKIANYQGLRGIAFIFIFISHCTFSIIGQGKNSTAYFGAFGVSLFIVLAGFLTVYNHCDSNDLSVKEQITKTVKKCYPLHIITFLLAIPFSIREFIKPNINTWIASFLNIMLLQSWVPKSSVYFSNNAVSWYLSTYLFFMLISPFVVRLLKRFHTRQIIGLLILNLSMQIALALSVGERSWAHWIIYICPITRALDFVSGGGIAMLLRRIDIRNRSYCILLLLGVLSSVFLLGITTQTIVNYTFLVAVWSLPVCAIIVGLFGTEQERFSKVIFQNKFVLFLGKISLELFLIHQLVIRYVEVCARKLNLFSPFVYIIALLITVIGASVLYSIKVERKAKNEQV